MTGCAPPTSAARGRPRSAPARWCWPPRACSMASVRPAIGWRWRSCAGWASTLSRSGWCSTASTSPPRACRPVSTWRSHSQPGLRGIWWRRRFSWESSTTRNRRSMPDPCVRRRERSWRLCAPPAPPAPARVPTDLSSPAFIGGEGPTGMTWMFALALLLGLGLGPVINEYAMVDQSAIYQAAGGTALTVGVMGSYGCATSRDLIRWMRPLFCALLGVFGLSIVLILIGSGEHFLLNLAIYVIVSAYLAIYFQIIRRRATERDVVWIATGVFINVINIFLTLLRIFGGR